MPLNDSIISGGHPKVAATAQRAIEAWRNGEKVVVFCHYIQTGRVLRQVISQLMTKRYFGTWRNALSAAGFTCGRQVWSRQRIIDTIRTRLSRGDSMAQLRGDEALTSSAYLYFGGWGAALGAAGIDYQPPRRWSRQKLLDEIRSRHKRALPLVTSCREIWYLVEAACRQFGSWGAALAAAGVPPNQQHWTKEGIIQAIRERYGEHVESPVRSRKLEAAALRHFGSWANALFAAGVTSPQERLRQKVLEILQDRYAKGESLDSLKGDAALVAAAKRAFRSWQKAMLAAGLREGTG